MILKRKKKGKEKRMEKGKGIGESDIICLWPARTLAVFARNNQYPGLSLMGAVRSNALRCKN